VKVAVTVTVSPTVGVTAKQLASYVGESQTQFTEPLPDLTPEADSHTAPAWSAGGSDRVASRSFVLSAVH
jgi:hypothetical protein